MRWAPFNPFIVVSVRLAEPLPVSFEFRGRQQLFEHGVAYLEIAASLHASGVDSSAALVHFFDEILSPVVLAEGMATRQAELVGIVNRVIADLAEATIVLH